MKIISNSDNDAFIYSFIILILRYIKFDEKLFQFLYSTGKTDFWQFLVWQFLVWLGLVFSLTRFEVIGL